MPARSLFKRASRRGSRIRTRRLSISRNNVRRIAGEKRLRRRRCLPAESPQSERTLACLSRRSDRYRVAVERGSDTSKTVLGAAPRFYSPPPVLARGTDIGPPERRLILRFNLHSLPLPSRCSRFRSLPRNDPTCARQRSARSRSITRIARASWNARARRVTADLIRPIYIRRHALRSD